MDLKGIRQIFLVSKIILTFIAIKAGRYLLGKRERNQIRFRFLLVLQNTGPYLLSYENENSLVLVFVPPVLT